MAALLVLSPFLALAAACAEDGPSLPFATVDPASLPSLHELELDAAAKVNERRQAEGLPPLEPSETLAAVARAYSCRMGEEEFFDHVSPDGDSVADRVEAAGVRYLAVGENLAFIRGTHDPVDIIVDGWMESPGHRANIVNDAYTHQGMGICLVGETYYFTQVFLRPR
jgi:uncharacterized protein YkwD